MASLNFWGMCCPDTAVCPRVALVALGQGCPRTTGR